MPNGSLIDSRFFEQPGFEELFEVWGKVFDARNELKPVEALAAVDYVRNDLVARNIIRTVDMNVLESVACRYARIMNEILQVEMLGASND